MTNPGGKVCRYEYGRVIPCYDIEDLDHTMPQGAASMVAESDPQANSLGYKADATKVDKTKQPKYAAGQVCTNCALFQGKASDAAGGCPLFAGKQVAGKGWCSAYAKKA